MRACTAFIERREPDCSSGDRTRPYSRCTRPRRSSRVMPARRGCHRRAQIGQANIRLIGAGGELAAGCDSSSSAASLPSSPKRYSSIRTVRRCRRRGRSDASACWPPYLRRRDRHRGEAETELEGDRDQTFDRAEDHGVEQQASRRRAIPPDQQHQQEVDLPDGCGVEGEFQQQNAAHPFAAGASEAEDAILRVENRVVWRKRLSSRGWLFSSHHTARAETMAMVARDSDRVSVALVGGIPAETRGCRSSP